MAKQQRVGILGGTFDPIHLGHVQMALSVLNAGYLDQLLIMPTGNPPYKTCVAGPEDRWKMTVAACASDERLVPSRLEIDCGESIYTIDTLSSLRKLYPKARLFYVIGADALMKIHRWHRYEEVLPLCTFLVCPRAGASDPVAFSAEKSRLTAMGGRFVIVQMDPLPVSSSDVRSTLSLDRVPANLNVAVREYCICKGLYGLSGRLDHIDEWMEWLFTSLNPKRFAHSLSVAYTARRLAKIHGINPLQAEQAGLLHDCAKCLPLREMQQIAHEHSLTSDSTILSSSALLHSLVGAWVARNRYHMADPEVLDAIACHNTASAGMSRLSMCVCLADSIEPLRQSYPRLEQVRVLSELSLERALLLSLEGTAEYVLSRGKYLHPRTQHAIEWLRSIVPERNQEKSGPREPAPKK